MSRAAVVTRAIAVAVAGALVAATSACTSDRAVDDVASPPAMPVATIGPATGGASGTGTAAGAGSGADEATGDGSGSGTSSDKPGGSEGANLGQAAPVLGSTAAPPTLTLPLPATASARNTLVEGFPTAIVPVPDGATVVSSSVAAHEDRLQVGLEASTPMEPDAVLEHYLGTLIAEGFAPSDSPAQGGSTATAFTRGADGLVLTTSARIGGGTELSVAGTLVAVG